MYIREPCKDNETRARETSQTKEWDSGGGRRGAGGFIGRKAVHKTIRKAVV